MVKPTYFTICSKNYLAYALTLGRSLRDADPSAEFLIFLADTALSPELAAGIEFEMIPASALDLPNLADMTLRYSIMEFNTSIKPACFEYLFARRKSRSAVYLDPDILVLRPLEHVEAALDGGADMVLTPHALSPLDDGGDPDDLRLLRTGVYNLGFAAIRNSGDSARFLSWWKDRLATDCRVALEEGIFVDQKWMDLAPSYVSRTEILRHPGYNVAYWNLGARPVERDGDGWLAAGQPLHFFHFSGVKPEDGMVFSKHQNRFSTANIGDLADLLHDYLQRLAWNGHSQWSREPYGYALPAEFAPIDAFVRGVFRRLNPEPLTDPDVKQPELSTLCNTPSAEISQGADARVTNLTYEIWAQRSDLRRAFDLSSRAGQERYNTWLLTSGVEEHRIPTRFLQPVVARSTGGAPPRDLPLRARLLHRVLQWRHLLRPLVARMPERWVDAGKRWIQSMLVPRRRAQEPALPRPSATTDQPTVPLAVYGYFNAESGLGEAVRRLFRALRGAGVPAVARSVSVASVFRDREPFEFAFDASGAQAQIHLVHVNADQVVHAGQWADADTFADSHYRIGFWAWELERFPEAWAAAFASVDEIWTPSRFVADAVSARTDKPVHVFPHPVPVPDQGFAQSDARAYFALPADGVLFLNVFDFNSFTERKNPAAALDAFEQAQKSAPDLGLVLKCHGGTQHDRERESLLARARRLKNVYIVDRVLSAVEIGRLYDACDGLISLHRSEGFGLTIAEAMARAKAVVATGYSGSCDFFDGEVGVEIPFELVPVSDGAYPHGEGAHWAEPDIAAASQALAGLAADARRREQLGELAQRRIQERLSSDRIGRLMARRIDAVLDQLDAREGQCGPETESADPVTDGVTCRP